MVVIRNAFGFTIWKWETQNNSQFDVLYFYYFVTLSAFSLLQPSIYEVLLTMHCLLSCMPNVECTHSLATDTLTKPNNSSRIISTEVSAMPWQHHGRTHTRTSHTPWLRQEFVVRTCARHIASQIYIYTYCIQWYRDVDSIVHFCVGLLAADAAACIDINKLFFDSVHCDVSLGRLLKLQTQTKQVELIISRTDRRGSEQK